MRIRPATAYSGWVVWMRPCPGGPDGARPHLERACHFGVPENFDHPYRYANLYEMIEHRRAE